MRKGQDRKKIALFLATAALIVALDQLSKLWIRANLTPGESLPQTGFLRLTYVTNTGSAFGLFANQAFLLTIITIASLLIILLFLRYLSPTTTLSNISLGLILGGAAGNLIDRLRLGCVTDFIDVRLWHTFHWPAFNLADAAIVIGIFSFIYFICRFELFRKVHEHNHTHKN